MKNIIEKTIQNSFSYVNYKKHVLELMHLGKSTGNLQSEDLLHYSELNSTRLKRLDKTIKITPEVCNLLENISKKQTWIVLAEGWCGDAAQLVPIINKMAEVSEKIDLKIALRDENEDLMNLFLTNGAKAIPKLIILDANNNVIADFGPRPAPAKKLIVDYKAINGVVDEPIKIELQKWYLQDKGVSTQNEIMALISNEVLV